MKITVAQLRRVIKEEVSRALRESMGAPQDLGYLHELPNFSEIVGITPDYQDYDDHQARLVPAPESPGLFHVETEDPDYGGWEPLYADAGQPMLFNADGSLAM